MSDGGSQNAHLTNAANSFTSYYELWPDPLVAVICDGDFLGSGLRLAVRAAAGRRCYVLAQIWWDVSNRIPFLREAQARMAARYPNVRLIAMAPTRRHLQQIRAAGLQAFLCHHNALLDERIFYPDPAAPKRYRAVYNGRASPMKRHHLAYDVPEMAVVTYAKGEGADEFLRAMIAGYKDLRFINVDAEQELRLLEPPETRAVINQARCGLILSELEGGNYASMEYMLCGIPVLSTPSRGGREEFFDPRHTLIVEPHPDAVTQGVETLLGRALDPMEIRNTALVRARAHRLNLVTVLSKIIGHDLVKLADPNGWIPQFRHKLVNMVRVEVPASTAKVVAPPAAASPGPRAGLEQGP